MSEELNGSCCVLCAAMNYSDASDRREEPEGVLFQAIVAVIGALGFIAMFIL